MCGRASLAIPPKVLEKEFNAKFEQGVAALPSPLPSYNIAPTHWHPVICNDASAVLKLFRWGLIPAWAKDSKIGSKLINARSETILEKPAFRGIHQRRCLIPFDGFYEWKKVGKNRIPYRIVLSQRPIFSLAGIWETWKDPKGTPLSSFTILTQPPNELMQSIHNRMPVILTKEQEQIWLNNDLPIKELLKIIAPYPSDLMHAYRVSNRVNKVSVNDASLIKEVPDIQQGTLF
jgi:putative SOS response-associated peptidase YedK